MPIPVPPPDEQVEIARRVRGFLALAEKIEKRISAARIRVDKAVQATLAKAFRGELVPTEAGLAQREGREFESADQLLELIRAARQAASAPTARARPRHAVAASGAESFPDGLFTETPPPSPERPPDTADIPRPVPASCEGSPTPQADAKRADMSYDEAMGCVRAAFEEGGPRDREQAIHDVAAALGFQRVGSRVREDIDGYLRAAVRRGILGNDGGTYSLLARSAADYTRDHLIDMLLASVDGSWTDREEATRCTARHLGFRKAGSAFKAAMRSAINGAIRRGLLEYEGELIRKRAAGG